jgi:hypothetical protein
MRAIAWGFIIFAFIYFSAFTIQANIQRKAEFFQDRNARSCQSALFKIWQKKIGGKPSFMYDDKRHKLYILTPEGERLIKL